MKKTIKDLFLLLLVLLIGYNVVVNVYMPPFIKNINKNIKFAFIVALIPDRLTFVDFKYNNFESMFLTLDVYVEAVLKKDYTKFVNGISAIGFKYTILKGEFVPQEEGQMNPAFVLPFCQWLDAKFGTISYVDLDTDTEFNITDIDGKSAYTSSGKKDQDNMAFDLRGYLQGRPQDTIRIKLFFFPYYQNRFSISAYGAKINVKTFEPLFKKFNLKVDSGIMNFLVQITGQQRKILLTNQMEIQKLKIREDTGLDFKALFGVSYEQMGRFLTDSNGNVYVNFDLEMDDSRFGNLAAMYGKAFADNVGDRIKLGVVTAPVRQVTDLIWNLTGENIFRIFRLFGGGN
jgi:hypothetical protein